MIHCENCAHNKICKFKEATEKLAPTAIDLPENIEYELKCKYAQYTLNQLPRLEGLAQTYPTVPPIVEADPCKNCPANPNNGDRTRSNDACSFCQYNKYQVTWTSTSTPTHLNGTITTNTVEVNK